MSEIKLRSDFDVDLLELAGSDEWICRAARVSTLGADSIDSTESEGLIRFLLSNRHGSPFEHGFMMFRISAPIFVWREFMRHRIGFSYNEQSGRYMELSPVFYMPPKERDVVQIGKPGHYQFISGDTTKYNIIETNLYKSYYESWDSYKGLLLEGVAKEVARVCLPLAIYSTAYVSCNPRSMMSFLSLRTKHEDSKFPSYPQWEINQVANKMETLFGETFPITHRIFHYAGRVSP